MQAKGNFDVEIKPIEVLAGHGHARMSLSKTFHGDLEATSLGEMLSAGNPASGSAGYVAIEEVKGRLGEREGSFFLMHTGLMDKGASSLVIQVVPGSGSGALEGLTGQLAIDFSGGGHAYVFDYELPAA